MKKQRSLIPIIRRHGALALGLAVLLALLCLPAVASPLDGPKSDREQERFRKKIVQSWNWQPRQGVGLTTEKYARKYLERYFDSSGEWKRESGPIASYDVLTEKTFVLFQTSSLDIIVVHPYRTAANDQVIVVHRESGKLLDDLDTGHLNKFEYEFVDVDGKKPLELMQTSRGCGGNSCSGQGLHVYELTEWDELLDEGGGGLWGWPCPKIVSQLVDPYPHRRKRDPNGHLTFEIRVSYELVMNHDGGSGYCQRSDPKTVIQRTCEYRADKARYECSDEVVESYTITLPELKTAYNWEPNAENIRWVLDNEEKLRARGFLFPDGFFDRLPRHLP